MIFFKIILAIWITIPMLGFALYLCRGLAKGMKPKKKKDN